MKNQDNFYYESLLQRINQLKVLKSQQELNISMQYSCLIASLNPEALIKDSIKHIATDSNTQKDLIKIAATTGTNYIIEKFLGSNNSIKRYLGSIITQKVSNSFIGSMISKFYK